MYVAYVTTDPTTWTIQEDDTSLVLSFWDARVEQTDDLEFSASTQVYVAMSVHARGDQHRGRSRREVGKFLSDNGYTPYRLVYPVT